MGVDQMILWGPAYGYSAWTTVSLFAPSQKRPSSSCDNLFRFKSLLNKPAFITLCWKLDFNKSHSFTTLIDLVHSIVTPQVCDWDCSPELPRHSSFYCKCLPNGRQLFNRSVWPTIIFQNRKRRCMSSCKRPVHKSLLSKSETKLGVYIYKLQFFSSNILVSSHYIIYNTRIKPSFCEGQNIKLLFS